MGKVLQFKKKGTQPTETTQAVTFKEFAQGITAGDMAAAAQVLAHLLAIDLLLAETCTLHFFKKFTENPEVLVSLMDMRTQLEAGENHAVLGVLQTCFGITGVDSVKIVTHLSKIYGKQAQ